MKTRHNKVIICIFLLILIFGLHTLYSQQFGTVPVRGKISFIELGSVKCVPCQMMKPVMIELTETFPEDVAVVFYDVWTPLGRPYGAKYSIKVIPTQVFLDREGKEFYRHEGFLPFDEILQILKTQGVYKKIE